STVGGTVDLAETSRRPTVLFFYPRTGVPGRPPPRFADGTEWDLVPGMRGCAAGLRVPRSPRGLPRARRHGARDRRADERVVFPPDQNAARVVAWLREQER